MVPEQAIHQSVLRLHHCLSGAGERYEGEHCELCAAVPEVCLRIWSRT